MVYLTAIRLQASGSRHEHITDVRWLNAGNNAQGQSTLAQLVAWLRMPDAVAMVRDAHHEVVVGIVEGHPPHLRTHADGVWTDNLLALPRF